MELWLQDKDTEMYSTHNERKSVSVERFIRNLNKKIFQHMTSISKNVFIDNLDDIVNKYNNTYRSTIRKPVGVKSSTQVDLNKEEHKEVPKFKVSDHVIKSKCKNTFAKGYVQMGANKFLRLKKLKILCLGHML